MSTPTHGVGAVVDSWRRCALADDATPSDLGCAGVAAALIDTSSAPASDAWFLCHGLDSAALSDWGNNGARRDRLFCASIDRGWSTGDAGRSGLRVRGRQPKNGTHVLWVSSPESPDGTLRWCAVFLRGGSGFSDRERDVLIATTRRWQARFNHPEEEGLSNLLVGDHDRVIHADAESTLRLLDEDIEPATFVRGFIDVLAQRWDTLEHGRSYDAIVPFGRSAVWATALPRGPVFPGAGGQTLIEIRSIEEDSLPALGLIDDDRVARTLGSLHDHYHESPRLTDLADEAGVSAFHFHRVFAKCVGVSPKQYQLLRQLQIARWRLRCGREPIGQIAERVGFSNHAHFTATFRRMLGQSPSDYRATSY